MDGLEKANSTAKQEKMRMMRTITNSSRERKEEETRSKADNTSRTSNAVSTTPQTMGMPTSSLRAIADPTTSARSDDKGGEGRVRVRGNDD